MKNLDNDILKETSLKECPFSVPEGYFDTLKKKVMRCPATLETPKAGRRRLLTVMASIAAALLIMVTVGTLFFNSISLQEDFTQEDYIVFSSGLDIYEDDTYEQYADAGVTEEDIIEYLIYSGVGVEDFEQYYE